jgi:hypothetical protein
MTSKPEPIDEDVIIQSRLISLNSKYSTYKINGDKLSSVIFDFNGIASKNRETLYHTIAIQSAEITASYYNVNSGNNTFRIERNTLYYSIAVPEGNYNANTFITAFLNAYSTTITGSAAEMTFNANTGKFLFADDDYDITITGTGTNGAKIFGLISGTNAVFRTGQTTNDSAPRIANFLGITKIKVNSNALAGDNFDSAALNTTTLIDTISATSIPFGLTIFNSLGRESFIKAKKIDEIDIQLLDQDNEFIDFNGIDWTLTIILNTHRRQHFTKDIGIIIHDKYVATQEAMIKPDSLKKELEEVEFIDDDLI